jgi:hypothetical protein
VIEAAPNPPAAPAGPPISPGAQRFIAFLEHPRLALRLGLLAALLVSPSLFIGFHLDDYVHRYLLSGIESPDAVALRRAYESPFGIANGDRADNLWQVEAGYAPYWIDPDLLVSLYRPLSELSHQLDAAFFPSSALLQHAHNVLWYALLVAAAVALYRSLLGRTTTAGLAALLYAVDHTHGFAVGWIANRNAPIAACFGCLALLFHHKARTERSFAKALLAGALLLAALLSGEGAVAIAGFLFAHTVFLDRDAPLGSKLAFLAPHALALIAWRALYAAFDRGAHGSGLYLDPAREPLAFALAAVERIPVLLFGELLLPPAEAYVFTSPPLPAIMWVVAVALMILLAVAAAPLVKRDRMAAFWALSTALALVPAVSTHPNNRLLFFVGLGAMGLLSQLWHGVLENAPWLPMNGLGLTRVLAACVVGFHLVISPFLLPLTACSVALTAPAREAADAILAASKDGADVIVLTAPDFYYTKLARPIAALEGRPEPHRLRALSFGAVPVTVIREDARTLLVRYQGGLLREPLLTLYRAADNPVREGERIALDGLSLQVTEVTPDGHIEAVRCAFDQDLDTPTLRFLAWDGAQLSPVRAPRVGGSLELPPASVRFAL